MITATLGLALLLAAPRGAAAPGEFAREVRVGTPVTEGNLTVFPLTLRGAAAGEDPLALDEALRAGRLSVTEAGAGGDVNALEVENRGDRPVVIVAGELLLGGKQDRIVGRSLVLAPRSRARVPVFCVEHGRWSGGAAFESAHAMGHVELRKLALSGDQGKVWSEVARSNARLGTQSRSDTYRAAARKLGGDAGPLARRILDRLAAAPGVAGLAVAIDGEVVAVEWFGSPRLFAKLEQKLVASYAAQALGSARLASPPASPRASDVADFAARAERGEGALRERVEAAPGAPPVQHSYLKR